MTLALGILAEDGTVIAADMQETRGDTKVLRSKIVTFKSKGGASCVVAGAGWSMYVDEMTDTIKEVFDKQSADTFRDKFGQRLHGYYTERVTIGFSSVPIYDRPTLDFVIAHHDGAHKPVLLVTEHTAVAQVKPYSFAAVGSGAKFATLLLQGLVDTHVDVRVAQLIAVYVVQLAKEAVDGCGGPIQVSTLQQTVTALTWQEIEQVERLFRTWYPAFEKANWWTFIGQYVDTSGPTIEVLLKPKATPEGE